MEGSVTKETYLNEQRAQFVYESARLFAMAVTAPVIPAPWKDREHAFKMQFLEVINRQCGIDREIDSVRLHESWLKSYAEMGWTYGPVYDPEKKFHPDMVPFGDLPEKEQNKDDVFFELCEIARKWIYE